MYKVEIKRKVVKQILKLDRSAQIQISQFLISLQFIDPRSQGKELRGKMKGLWRYRLGNYRLVTQIRDEILTVIVLKAGHRKAVYR
jgi:mRNA interferase RelE/StbE